MSNDDKVDEEAIEKYGEDNKPELYFELSIYEKDDDGTRADEPTETTGVWNTTPKKVNVEEGFVIDRAIDYLIDVLEHRSVEGLDY
jgi:hypothetical protein